MLSEESTIDLPTRPADQLEHSVAAWSEPLTIDTYHPVDPDRYPQFLDARVYQGSSGKVFPLPFFERIEAQKRAHEWQAVHLENEWMRLVILPELGGRIHIAYDKSTDYDIFYRNNVIKPALVGLTGPWIAGGVEFNWPQHHRPATYLPTDMSIERESDGSVTVWCSDHDPFHRMKGMHGIRLRPDSSAIEVRARLFNRSEETQTFLWWANVAAAVGDEYQSFFPTDVHHVADHAKRAVVSFPRVDGEYYGVDYAERVDREHPDADRLDWYRNIPVPTSYMVTDTDDSFFGGYDHGRGAGFVHWADRAIAPGKKQWTWGNSPFGDRWGQNLTDSDGPYIELMAGVYTDNQPDFSFLTPGETKTFSQFWYPISQIGPAMQATRDAAIRVDVRAAGGLRVGVASSVRAPASVVEFLHDDGTVIDTIEGDIAPGNPLIFDWDSPVEVDPLRVTVRVSHAGRVLVTHRWRAETPDETAPASAIEPPTPSDVATVEELSLIALYLEQYRHATRSPEPYLAEALSRDPHDLRSNLALGSIRYRSARYEEACEHFERAVARETRWAPNPPDGQAHYLLGLALRRCGRPEDAIRAFEKATWNGAQAVPALLELARLRAATDPEAALAHAQRALLLRPDHLQVRNAIVVLGRRLGRDDEAGAVLRGTLAIDPLDQWARDLDGQSLTVDAPTLLDIALEYCSLGADVDADRLLDVAARASASRPAGQVNVAPLLAYHAAAAAIQRGDHDRAVLLVEHAATVDATNALPSRLDDVDALLRVADFAPGQPLPHSLLGSWYFDAGRPADATRAWTAARSLTTDRQAIALLERNLGIAAYNNAGDAALAVAHFAAARTAQPDDARLLYESDQLAARTGVSAADRLSVLDSLLPLVQSRDDLSIERAVLLTVVGRLTEALDVLETRTFQPWEGGEGVVLDAWDALALALARLALAEGDTEAAMTAIGRAVDPPAHLGEARHPLATTAHLHLALGDALAAVGRVDDAAEAWKLAAEATGDFASMSTDSFTERSAFSISAAGRLGRFTEVERALSAFADYITEQASTPAEVDYFATSLPAMLLFHDDPTVQRDERIGRLRAIHAALTAESASTAH